MISTSKYLSTTLGGIWHYDYKAQSWFCNYGREIRKVWMSSFSHEDAGETVYYLYFPDGRPPQSAEKYLPYHLTLKGFCLR